METVQLPVTGMTCANCARSIQRKLQGVPGVSKAQVDLASAKATIEYDPGRAGVPDLVGAIVSLGYQVPMETS